jgi:hypothetical protein
MTPILVVLRRRIRLLLVVFALAPLAAASDKLTVSPANPRLLKNSLMQFTATLNGKDLTQVVRWTSSNPAVSAIDSSGRAALLARGTATITATLGALKASSVLTVTVAENPVFSAQPGDTNVSAVINAAGGVRVQLLDNLGGGLAGQNVLVNIGTNPPGRGTLSGTLTRSTDASGTATFSDLKIDWLGNGYTLAATANPVSGTVSGISNSFNEMRVGDPCLGAVKFNANSDTSTCFGACPSSNHDGLNDAWKVAGGIDINGDGLITDPQHDVLLPGAGPNKQDVFLQYDWMDYGPIETPCNNDLDCTHPYLGLRGATCSGPGLTQGFAGTCVLACTTDSDCTSKGPSHIADRCGIADGIQQCLHTHDPALLTPNGTGGSKALDAVVAAFANHDINLHIMRGQAHPHSHVVSFHELANPANAISSSCEGGSVADGTAGLGKYAEGIYDLKSRSFNPNLNQAYHYAIFGHYSTCDSPAHCGACPPPLNTDGTTKNVSVVKFQSSGVSEFFGNDLIVSLANFIDEKGNTPDVYNLGGTFMHELGHNFGLHHGGGFDADGTAEDTPDFKPNFLSVMSYNYQFVGIPEAGGGRRLDYSTQVLPQGTATPGLLDENGRLDEPAGLGSGDNSLMFFYDGACGFQVAPTEGPVDWDGDGVAGDNPAATSDLDPYNHLCGAVTSELFRGHMDWPSHAPPNMPPYFPGSPKFTYGFQCTSLAEDPPPAGSTQPTSVAPLAPTPATAPLAPQVGELTAEMAERAHVLYPPAFVKIVIQPGCSQKNLVPGHAGTFQVALLGDTHFNVNDVDVSGLNFHGAKALSTEIRDVNNDGIPDLVIQFRGSETRLSKLATKGRLSGWLKNSQVFVGEDRVSPSLGQEDPSCSSRLRQ